MRQPPKKPDIEKFMVVFIVSLLLIAAVVSFTFFRTATVGQAIAPVLLPLNITIEEQAAQPILMEDGERTEFNLTTTLESLGDAVTVNITLYKLNSNSIKIFITPEGPLEDLRNILAEDIIYLSGIEEPLILYFDEHSMEPDMEITYNEGIFSARNLNHVPPAPSFITLLNGSGAVLPSLIRLEPESDFSAIINATSTSAPDVSATISHNPAGLQVLSAGPVGNTTTASLTWTAPAESSVVLLDIVADQGSSVTHAYYTIIIGVVIYAQPEYPKLELRAPAGATPTLSLTLKGNTSELQPLGLPCLPTQSLTQMFSSTPVRRIVTFSQDGPVVWSSQGKDFDAFERFKGYYLESTNAENVTLQIPCQLDEIQPQLVPGQNPYILRAGWHLFSLPGTIQQSLTTFTRGSFELYDCPLDGECQEIAAETPLNPGKPYWIYTGGPLIIKYQPR